MYMKTKNKVNLSSDVGAALVAALAGYPQGVPLQNRTNEPGMYMKTNDKVKMSRLSAVSYQRACVDRDC